jgi:hypothetical protein
MRSVLLRQLADIGDEGWGLCPCGHRASIAIASLARRWPDATVGSLRRSMRCGACRRRSGPMLGVVLRLPRRMARAQPSEDGLQAAAPAQAFPNAARPEGPLPTMAEVRAAQDRLTRALSTGGATDDVGAAACAIIRRSPLYPGDAAVEHVHCMEARLGMKPRPVWVTPAGVCLDPRPRPRWDYQSRGGGL